MAKVSKNGIAQGWSGSIWKLVFRHMPDGSTRVSVKPDFSRRVFSQKQKDHQQKVKIAAAYAREASKTQPIYAELARGTTKNAYNIALSDWFHPPVVHNIERKKGRIRVMASDNVSVTKVQVRIIAEDGKILEEGQAVQVDPVRHPERWEYASNTEGTIEATAWDLADNQAKAVL